MSIQTVYVRAKSKKAINELLADGQTIWGKKYDIYGSDIYGSDIYGSDIYGSDIYGSESIQLHNMPKGTVVKVYEKVACGNPVAKSYGTWTGQKVA